jgi:hypothetical protein
VVSKKRTAITFQQERVSADCAVDSIEDDVVQLLRFNIQRFASQLFQSKVQLLFFMGN